MPTASTRYAASLHLFLKVVDVVLLVGALHVALWIAGAAHAEIPLGLDVLYQLDGVGVGAGDKLLGPVAPQRQDILNAPGFHLLQALVNLLPGGGTAGEMGQGGDMVGVLDVRGHLHRLFRGAARRAVGDADKIRAQLVDGVHGLKNAAELHVFFRGENLAGENDFPVALLKQVFYFQNGSHLSFLTRETRYLLLT